MKIKTTAIMLALLMLFTAFVIPACKLTTDDEEPDNQPVPGTEDAPEATSDPDAAATEEVVYTPWPENAEYDSFSVILRCKDVELTMYDFGQAFYSNQYVQYYMYGMIGADQYCNMVVDDLSAIAYLVNEAKENGMELTEEEIAGVDTLIDEHVEKLIQSYSEQVEEDVEDKLAAGKAAFEKDLAEDGLNIDTFKELAKKNLYLHQLADNYYAKLTESVRVSDDEVLSYINDNMEEAQQKSFSDFADSMDAFVSGNGPFPIYIADDCFSVNHIYLAFETETTENDIVYLTDSRKEDEAAVEAKLPELEDFDAFMEYEKEIGEDPGMDEDSPYRTYGYLIHPDLLNSYFAGFVYAAMNLHEGTWEEPIDAGTESGNITEPNLTFFELKDGEKVVKVCTESGIHYIIVNKEYKRGATEYEVGDDNWESWRLAASEDLLTDMYEQLSNEWKEKYPIEVDYATIKAKYAPADEEATD